VTTFVTDAVVAGEFELRGLYRPAEPRRWPWGRSRAAEERWPLRVVELRRSLTGLWTGTLDLDIPPRRGWRLVAFELWRDERLIASVDVPWPPSERDHYRLIDLDIRLAELEGEEP
jgi:hypothetical protein